VLAFFGVINGTALGFGNSSSVALGYLLVAAICLGMRYYRAPVSLPIDDDSVAREPAGD
jgi:hypothetical protein